MAAYRRVYDSRHLPADCQEPGSAPEPYTLSIEYGLAFLQGQMSRYSGRGEANVVHSARRAVVDVGASLLRAAAPPADAIGGRTEPSGRRRLELGIAAYNHNRCLLSDDACQFPGTGSPVLRPPRSSSLLRGACLITASAPRPAVAVADTTEAASRRRLLLPTNS